MCSVSGQVCGSATGDVSAWPESSVLRFLGGTRTLRIRSSKRVQDGDIHKQLFWYRVEAGRISYNVYYVHDMCPIELQFLESMRQRLQYFDGFGCPLQNTVSFFGGRLSSGARMLRWAARTTSSTGAHPTTWLCSGIGFARLIQPYLIPCSELMRLCMSVMEWLLFSAVFIGSLLEGIDQMNEHMHLLISSSTKSATISSVYDLEAPSAATILAVPQTLKHPGVPHSLVLAVWAKTRWFF